MDYSRTAEWNNANDINKLKEQKRGKQMKGESMNKLDEITNLYVTAQCIDIASINQGIAENFQRAFEATGYDADQVVEVEFDGVWIEQDDDIIKVEL